MPESSQRPLSFRTYLLSALGVAAIAAVLVVGYFVWSRSAGLPAAGSGAYEQATRGFYRGLAGLQVGLIDAAKDEFTRAAAVAEAEPAIWANLGLAHLRLGEFDGAAPAIERAIALAPDDPAVVFLRGRLDTARGRREEGLVHLRRAVELDPRGLHARTALIQEVENAGGPEADAEAQRLLEELVALQPDNVAVLIERARLAAKRADRERLGDSVSRLGRAAGTWPPEVIEQYRGVEQATAEGNMADAARSIAFLRNVLARVPAFLESRRLVTPSAELVAEPFTRFLRLSAPTSAPSPRDDGLAFAPESLGGSSADAASAVLAVSLDGVRPADVFVSDAQGLRRLDAPGPSLQPAPGAVAALAALDWNHDFRMDLVTAGPGGVRLFIQSPDGTFTDRTAAASGPDGGAALDATGLWPADVEMDGDLDIVVAVRNAMPVVLRNNGEGTWRSIQPFGGVTGVRDFVWGDLDADGDPDAALVDGTGVLHVRINLQAGQFEPLAGPAAGDGIEALAIGDLDADGLLDLVTLHDTGQIRRASAGRSGWAQHDVSAWQPAGAGAGVARLVLADLDNNGALDVLASRSSGAAIWLAGEDRVLRPLGATIDADVSAVLDMNADGRLDLLGLANGRPVRFVGRGTFAYHYQVLRPRAQAAAGDQRINSFGIGGEIEMRSGLLVQKQTITGPVLHFGLGTRTGIDVTRIVWPNGVPQAEFDPAIDQAVVAEQRLKGSCPWIFADDGSGMRFVTDFLWRSPLGLRINASDTAGVTQTEDWVRIAGDQLVARDGAYAIRMSAELWETHFVDQMSLMVVDHPDDVDIFVDERFAPAKPPALVVHAMRQPRPIVRAWDQEGQDVTAVVSARDGRHLGAFARGQYQGVAVDHFVEIELADPVPADRPIWLVGHGWVYPTDSSINVAIGQGGHVQPRSLSLEALDATGRWVVVATDLGFPAGKNKTVLIDLSGVAKAGAAGARRLRLRTNLEVYWDALATAEPVPDAPLRTERLNPSRADLGYRGFSQTNTGPREQPETPVYERLASVSPRWRDLVGYYTRFGDVRELLLEAEDRYMIMNAGDELRLSFPAPPAPPAGWTRDFVLIGDGWVKDGDFNTSFARTVLPLPEHGKVEYESATRVPSLERDPVFRRHAGDWQTFHTRFVEPRAFLDGLRY